MPVRTDHPPVPARPEHPRVPRPRSAGHLSGMPSSPAGAMFDAEELAGCTGALLAAHVPLSLLFDLCDPGGPHSDELLSAEPGDADWLPPA